jgi:hypothetical protein
MKKKLIFSLSLTLIASLMFIGSAFARPAPKVDVCHSEGNGTYHLISINENAFDKHVSHGDASPGDIVPGMQGKRFTDDCTLMANVAGGWDGLFGIVGDLDDISMTFYQDSSGNVTGFISYDIVRTVTGSVIGNEFSFLMDEDPSDTIQPYWAECNPCTVSDSGTWFQGFGKDSDGLDVEFQGFGRRW